MLDEVAFENKLIKKLIKFTLNILLRLYRRI